MNAGQTMFKTFVMGMVKDGKKDELEALLKKCFDAQDAGKFDKDFLMSISPELKDLVVEEALPKLEDAMKKFADKM